MLVEVLLTSQYTTNASFFDKYLFQCIYRLHQFWYPYAQTKHIKPIYIVRGMIVVDIRGVRTMQLSRNVNFMVILCLGRWWIQGCIQVYFGTYWVHNDS